MPESLVYDNPTITRLGSYISTFVLGTKASGSKQSTTASGSSSTRFDAMHAMVAKYTTGFPAFHPSESSAPPEPSDVVLVTGTTGSLGCHLLAQLASNSGIRRVYALNRPPRDGKTIRQRQENALRARGLDVAILDQDRVVLLEGSLVRPMFGLPDTIYNEVCAITCVRCYSRHTLTLIIDACFCDPYHP